MLLTISSGIFRGYIVDKYGNLASPKEIGVKAVSTDIDWYVFEDKDAKDLWETQNNYKTDYVYDLMEESNLTEYFKEIKISKVHVVNYEPIDFEPYKGCRITIDKITDVQGNEQCVCEILTVDKGLGMQQIYSRLYRTFVEAGFGSEDSFVLVKIWKYIPPLRYTPNVIWILVGGLIIVSVIMLLYDHIGKLKLETLLVVIIPVTIVLGLVCLFFLRNFTVVAQGWWYW